MYILIHKSRSSHLPFPGLPTHQEHPPLLALPQAAQSTLILRSSKSLSHAGVSSGLLFEPVFLVMSGPIWDSFETGITTGS
jgi:hypothetical protein